MKKEEMTTVDFLLEAVGIVAAMIYLGLQIYYGIVYGVAFTGIILNAAILILVYVGLTLLAHLTILIHRDHCHRDSRS